MVASVVELRVPRAVPELVARLERIGEEAGVSQESTTPEERKPPSQSPPSRETESGVSEELTETEEGDSSLDELDLDITLERRQRRLDDDIDPELLQIFIDEAQELVPSVGSAMRDWRDNPDNAVLGQAQQRVLHTLKGRARMEGAMELGELTHHMETRVENAMSVKTLPTALFAELETPWDRMGILFERLQKPRVPEESLPAMAVASKPATVAIEASEATPEPAPEAPAAAAKVVPLAERELQPKALLRVRADIVDRLVNEAGEGAIARSPIQGGKPALKAALPGLPRTVPRVRAPVSEIRI